MGYSQLNKVSTIIAFYHANRNMRAFYATARRKFNLRESHGENIVV